MGKQQVSESASQRKRTEILNVFGHTLAYEHCCSVIETSGVKVTEEECGDIAWFDISEKSTGVDAIEGVADAVRYLEMRELLMRHPKNGWWVMLFDESTAGQ